MTASAFIILMDEGVPKLMFHMHKKIHRYMQFGGHVELNETPWQAVTHEILEESGYGMQQLQLLQPESRLKHLSDADLHPVAVCQNTHKFDDTHYHTDTAYAFITSQSPEQPPVEGESTDMKLFDRASLLADPDIQHNIKEIGLFIFDVCLPEWEQVPATTEN